MACLFSRKSRRNWPRRGTRRCTHSLSQVPHTPSPRCSLSLFSAAHTPSPRCYSRMTRKPLLMDDYLDAAALKKRQDKIQKEMAAEGNTAVQYLADKAAGNMGAVRAGAAILAKQTQGNAEAGTGATSYVGVGGRRDLHRRGGDHDVGGNAGEDEEEAGGYTDEEDTQEADEKAQQRAEEEVDAQYASNQDSKFEEEKTAQERAIDNDYARSEASSEEDSSFADAAQNSLLQQRSSLPRLRKSVRKSGLSLCASDKHVQKKFGPLNVHLWDHGQLVDSVCTRLGRGGWNLSTSYVVWVMFQRAAVFLLD